MTDPAGIPENGAAGGATTVPPVPLSPELENELRQAGRQVGKWMEKRDGLIRQAAADGASLRAIGEAVGLSHTAVRFIAYGRPPREPSVG